jgi:hypothetical protein
MFISGHAHSPRRHGEIVDGPWSPAVDDHEEAVPNRDTCDYAACIHDDRAEHHGFLLCGLRGGGHGWRRVPSPG